MARIRYVRNDQRPGLRVSLELGAAPIDVSAGGVTVRAHVRLKGESAIKASIVGVKSTGRRTACDPDTGEWTVDTSGSWAVPGAGGIVIFQPGADVFDQAAAYEVEYEIDWGGSVKQTIYEVDQVLVRADFA